MWLLMFSSNSHLQAAADEAPNLPRLFVLGDKDNFTSERSLRTTLQKYFPQALSTAAIVQGADHFWVRRERDVMAVVAQWLLSVFAQCQGDLVNLRNLELGIVTSSRKLSTKFGTKEETPES